MKSLLFSSMVALLCATSVHAQATRQWTYTAMLTGSNGSQYVYAGSSGRNDPWEPDGIRHYTGFAMLNEAANFGPQSGNARLTIGSTFGSGFFWDADGLGPGRQLDPQFTASISITDTLSGESGTVSYTGNALSYDSYIGLPTDLQMPEMPVVWQLESPHRVLTLGGHDYQVQLGQTKINPRFSSLGEEWDRIDVEAMVVTSPPSLDSPEPGTIVLGAAGLAGAWGVRRIRKLRGV